MTLDPRPQAITVRIKDACSITGIGRSKLYELIAAGEIKIVKVGTMSSCRWWRWRNFLKRRDKRLMPEIIHRA